MRMTAGMLTALADRAPAAEECSELEATDEAEAECDTKEEFLRLEMADALTASRETYPLENEFRLP